MSRFPARRGRRVVSALAIVPFGVAFATASIAHAQTAQRPCDLYAGGGTPCVAAHSTTRALYASYNGPLYQLKRVSDGATKAIGVLAPGGYADAAAQDAFCADTRCVIAVIYDQSPKGNDLKQAPPGTFKGPAPGQYNELPIADMAPTTINGHRVYGAYIVPGMGYRNNQATGIAVDDEPEGIYMVFDGTHYDSGCCFDYGNAQRSSTAEGVGTMETVYFGTATAWTRGTGPGPWLMADLEAGLYASNLPNGTVSPNSPTITDRFVSGFVNGDSGNHFQIRKGNAQTGGLDTFHDGPRPNGYAPMHKKGAVLLGTGGDNGNGSAGTFYEGVMTAGFPSDRTTDAVQADIVAAKYNPAQVTLAAPKTFTANTTQTIATTYTNSTGETVTNVNLAASVPAGFTVTGTATAATLAPGQSITATLRPRSGASTAAGYLKATATWTNADGSPGSETTQEWIRSVFPIKINEVRLSVTGAATNSFVELYNASTSTTPVDLSGWTIAYTPSGADTVTLATIPAGTTLARGAFYLLGGPSYTGATAPNLSYASTLNATGGSFALQDAAGTLTDGVVYGTQQSSSSGNGTITSPWIARTEGGTAQGGCIAIRPTAAAGNGNSLIRWANGADTDSNCIDLRSSPVPTPGAANAFGVTAVTTPTATVPSMLSLTLGPAAAFGALTPAVTRDYAATMTANLVSTAANAALTAIDASTTATGHLVNGSFALPSPVRIRATSPTGTGSGAFAEVGGFANPTPLLSYSAPVSNDPVTLDFQQHVDAADPLRAGSYSKTITFTLSTTAP